MSGFKFVTNALHISLPIACANGGGTAFPICRCFSTIVPVKQNLSGKPCERAHSLTLITRFCSG